MEKVLAKIVSTFCLKSVQESLIIQSILEKNNLSFAELRNYVNTHGVRTNARLSLKIKSVKKLALRCPKCSAPMTPFPVNTGPRDQIGGNYKTQWICPRAECRHEIFREDSLEEFIQKRRK